MIFRLYSKDIVKPMVEFDNVFGIETKYHRLRRFLVFFPEYQEYKMSIFGICFILYFFKLSAYRGFLVLNMFGRQFLTSWLRPNMELLPGVIVPVFIEFTGFYLELSFQYLFSSLVPEKTQ